MRVHTHTFQIPPAATLPLWANRRVNSGGGTLLRVLHLELNRAQHDIKLLLVTPKLGVNAARVHGDRVQALRAIPPLNLLASCTCPMLDELHKFAFSLVCDP